MPRKALDFDVVREVAMKLPDVEERSTSRGPSLTVRGKLLACPAIHKSAEPHSLLVRIDRPERADLLAADPETYYVTDHYLRYPAVLVRLARLNRRSLRALLEKAWFYVRERTRK